MTIDKQLDRFASPLASVSEQTYPENLEPGPEGSVGAEEDIAREGAETKGIATDPFQGFGSFSG